MANEKMVGRVIQIAHHRNGISGADFHAVVFEHQEDVCRGAGDD